MGHTKERTPFGDATSAQATPDDAGASWKNRPSELLSNLTEGITRIGVGFSGPKWDIWNTDGNKSRHGRLLEYARNNRMGGVRQRTCHFGRLKRTVPGLDRRTSQQAEVFRDIDIGHGKSAEQIQREILAAYQNKGYEAPTDFSRISRFVAAGTARRGTRTARSLIEIVGSIRAARRWAEDNAISEDSRLHNQEELRRIRRSAGRLHGSRRVGRRRCLLHQRIHSSWSHRFVNPAERHGSVGWTMGVGHRLDHPFPAFRWTIRSSATTGAAPPYAGCRRVGRSR